RPVPLTCESSSKSVPTLPSPDPVPLTSGPPEVSALPRRRLLNPAVSDPSAAWPARRHHIRVSGPVHPDEVWDAVRTHDVGASEVHLTRSAAFVLTSPVSSPHAAACALSLSGAKPDRVLVIPVLESQ